MPALWPTFIPAVGSYINSVTEGRTHDDIAEKISSEYHKAVKTAMTSLHANMVLSQPPYMPIKSAIKKSLDDIFDSEGKPNSSHFSDWANATSAYWLATTMSPLPFHPLNMALSTGTVGVPVPITHIINNGGVIPALQADLLTAFTHPPSSVPYGIPFATKLSKAFITHLSSVGGLQTEFVTGGSVVTPVPIGPVPQVWVGLV